MTTGHKIVTVLAVVLGGLLIFAGWGWLQEHNAALVVQTQQKADADKIKALKDQQTEYDAKLADQLKGLATLKQTVVTPAQVVKALPQVINLPAPVVQVTPQQAAAVANLPDAPQVQDGDLIIPKADVKPFYDAQVDCKINATKVDACTQQEATDNEIIAVKDQQITQLNQALKGGTKWQRTKSTVGKVALGIGIAVAAQTIYHATQR